MTDSSTDLVLEPLSSRHKRTEFCCGVPPLDRYLNQQAGQDARKHAAATFVLVEKSKSAILGFYTLAATSIVLEQLPKQLTNKLPRYPLVPAILLGRLAADQNQHGKGYGELLLMDALQRCLNTQEIGWTAVVVDAKDEQAAAYYEHYHFIRFSPDSTRLFLPHATITQLLK